MFLRTSKSTLMMQAGSALLGVCLMNCAAFAGTPDVSKDSKKTVIEQPVTGPKWYISLGGNTDFDIHGVNFTNDALGSVFGLNANIETRTFSATHEQPYSVHLEGGYVVSEHWELFGTFYFDSAGSDETRIGRAKDPNGVIGPVGGKYDIRADFDDYRSFGIELGARYFFLPKTSRLRPYISLSAGGRYIDSQDITLKVANQSATVQFYDDSFAVSTTVLAGIEFAFSERFSVGVDSGLAYHFEQTDRDENLTPNSAKLSRAGIAGLQSANDDGDRLYIPLTVYGKLRF